MSEIFKCKNCNGLVEYHDNGFAKGWGHIIATGCVKPGVTKEDWFKYLKIKKESKRLKIIEEKCKKCAKKLKDGKYKGKIVQADYSNLGIRLFNWEKLADNLDIGSWYRLQKLLDLGMEEVCGWNLAKEPTEQDILNLIPKLQEGHSLE